MDCMLEERVKEDKLQNDEPKEHEKSTLNPKPQTLSALEAFAAVGEALAEFRDGDTLGGLQASPAEVDEDDFFFLRGGGGRFRV